MWRGIAAARLGGRVTDISHAVESHVRAQGDYGILEDYVGHGIGSAMHQPPNVPNYGRPGRGPEAGRGPRAGRRADDHARQQGHRRARRRLDRRHRRRLLGRALRAHLHAHPAGRRGCSPRSTAARRRSPRSASRSAALTRAGRTSAPGARMGGWGTQEGSIPVTVVSSVRPGLARTRCHRLGRPSGRDLRRTTCRRPRASRRLRKRAVPMISVMGDSVASPLVWILTLVVTVGVLLVDLVVIAPAAARADDGARSSRHLAFFIGLAVLFGVALWIFAEPHALSPHPGPEFFAGWLTEYSLSIDNLFIFIIIMANFAVPRQYQQAALMVGIVLALVMRGDLHRRRRRRDQPVQLDLLRLRRVPALDRGQAGPGGRPRRRGGVRGEPARPVRRAAPAGDQRVRTAPSCSPGRTASA